MQKYTDINEVKRHIHILKYQKKVKYSACIIISYFKISLIEILHKRIYIREKASFEFENLFF